MKKNIKRLLKPEKVVNEPHLKLFKRPQINSHCYCKPDFNVQTFVVSGDAQLRMEE